jgi:hypothetical protein
MSYKSKYNILMDFPNWTGYEEIVNICDHISNNDIRDVLCAGTFGGRVAAAICRSFPKTHVTAIDTFHYIETYEELRDLHKMTCADKFLKKQNTLALFNTMHNYPNITAMKCDFFNYTKKHQMVIIELYPYNNTWEELFDYSLSLSDHVIGTCNQLDTKDGIHGLKVLNQLYNYEIVNESKYKNNYNDIYRVLSKKVQ